MKTKFNIWVSFFLWVFSTIMCFFLIGGIYAYQDKYLASKFSKSHASVETNTYILKKVWADYINLKNISHSDIKNILYFVSYKEGKYSSWKLELLKKSQQFDIKFERQPENILITNFESDWKNYIQNNYQTNMIKILQ